MRLTKREIKELKYWFREYDFDGSGKLTRTELKHAMRNIDGWNYSDYEIDEMLWEADRNGDGKINFKEFVKFFEGPTFGSSSDEYPRIKKYPKYKHQSGCCSIV